MGLLLRFTDTEVLNEINNVQKIIAEWIDDYELNYSTKSTPGASRHPRQRGI